MNQSVMRLIHGTEVRARPVFKQGARPSYWTGIIGNRTVHRTFASPSEVFRYAERALQEDPRP